MKTLLLIVLVFILAACKQEYIAPVKPVDTGYLVMEGVVNNGDGETNIRLSRTVKLLDNSIMQETGAAVKIQGNDNSEYPLLETLSGVYTASNLYFDTSLQYRISINTRNGEEYLSDYVKVKINPPIDSVSWERDNEGVHIFMNTHEPTNSARYYQWEYVETWEFNSAYFTLLKWIKDARGESIGVEYRTADDPKIYTCWRDNSSTSIILGSSAKLSSDIIYLPINLIENASQKLGIKYSIIVTQYAWSKEGYEFLERMKKNTESVGSIFDAQPSELNSNLHCISNPGQPTIGFFNICTIQKQRIFINNSQVPGWGYRNTCEEEQEITNNIDTISLKGRGRLPTVVGKSAGPSFILTFFIAKEECVDCRVYGTNVKPSFWP